MFDLSAFFLIEDEATRLRLFREGAKNHATATLWTTGKAVVLRTFICHFDINQGTFHAELPPELPLEKVLSIVSARDGIFFNVELPETRLFFRASFHHFEQSRQVLEFKLPTEAYKVQQRKHPRISTRNSRSIRAFHEDPLQAGRSIQRKVLDLSAGGLSIRLFFGEERHYRVGQQLKSLQVHLGQKIITCSGLVKSIRISALEGDKTELVLGLEFMNMDGAGQKAISNLVDQEMIKQFGKLVAKREKETD